MAIKRIDTIERFVATDSDGNRYQVIVQQEIIDASSLDDPHHEVRGMKSVYLSDGSRVNRIDADTFEVFQTGTIIKRA